MINIVNEAINRKLGSISFTNIIIGKVISLTPLQIRINNRIVIGQSFIEPMSLGLNDYSPNSALPLIVGETIQMIRYNNGQRFYVLGKSTTASTINYNDLQNLPRLVTTNDKSLECCTEEICNNINLHKVAKSGKYTDLLERPNLATVATSGKYSDLTGTPNLATVATSGKYSDLTGTPTNLVTTDTEQSISGKKTFSTLPESSITPTTVNQLINKNYVDTNFLQFEVIEEF